MGTTIAAQFATDADSIPLDAIDVSSPGLYQSDSHWPLFARLRREDPVHYCAESRYGPYWSVTRYQDIMDVELNHALYSSALGGIQLEEQPKEMERPSFIRMDPPRHTEQRRTVAPLMTPSHLAKLEATIRERACRILDALPRGETFDWVDAVSIELTTQMLATLFDFPWEDRRMLTHWSDVAIATVGGGLIESEEQRFAELSEMAAYFGRLWQERARSEPQPDLISMLAHGESTKQMPLREFMGNLALLIVGGNDTTRNTISGALIALNENPDEYRKLRNDPGLMTTFVPEVIRWQCPVIHMRRTPREDTELGGKVIRKGERVIMWYVSGNRDEDAIEDADRFIIDRPRARQHLGFGAGIHRCVGDRLAEMQLRIVWDEILKRYPTIEIVGEPVRAYSNFLRGIVRLPVRIPA